MSDQSIWGHLSDLRAAIIRIGCILLIGMLLSLSFSERIVHYLSTPYLDSLHNPLVKIEKVYNPSKNSISIAGQSIAPGQTKEVQIPLFERKLAQISPAEGMSSSFKVSFWCGALLTCPFWGWVIFRFIAPALHKTEYRLAAPFACLSLLAVFTGIGFALVGTIPIANSYLMLWNREVSQPMWSLSYYLDYTLFLMFANAVALELGVIGFFLVHTGTITADFMAAHRRGAILTAFILATLLTPPDVLTQILLAIPLISLYELLILYGRLSTKTSPTYGVHE